MFCHLWKCVDWTDLSHLSQLFITGANWPFLVQHISYFSKWLNLVYSMIELSLYDWTEFIWLNWVYNMICMSRSSAKLENIFWCELDFSAIHLVCELIKTLHHMISRPHRANTCCIAFHCGNPIEYWFSSQTHSLNSSVHLVLLIHSFHFISFSPTIKFNWLLHS